MRRLTFRFHAGYIAGSLLTLAWLLAWVVPLVRLGPWRTMEQIPYLPSVARPFRADSDIVSIVPSLFRCLTLILVVLLLVELTKFVLASEQRLSRLPLASISLFQAVLAVDTLRAHAYDWFVYLLSFAGLLELRDDRLVGMGTLAAATVPWMSLPFLLVAIAVLWVHRSAES